jgi:hypothetical protein
MLPDTKKAFEWNGTLPKVQRVRLDFPRPRILDIPAAVHQAVESLGDQLPDLQGRRVAVTAGSRGISQMPAVLSALIVYLRRLGADPFIVPAMGSHAGATAQGQKTMLAELGITENSTGAPVLSSMQTLELGRLENGMPVYMDRLAAGADAIVIVNRVKPHTDFSGRLESGLAKMTAVGLGKLNGAAALHRYGVHGLRDLMPAAARLVCRNAPVVFGLATIENAYHEVAHIRALPGSEIGGSQEEELLKLAYTLMPHFPFPELDVLVVEQMGKNISGVGMDPKVIGRVKVQGVPDLAPCVIHSLAVLRLTAETHGNATGVGLADVTTRALLAQIDFDTTI